MARPSRHDDLHVLDTAREPLFDSFVRMAADACESPIAAITLIDAERQWFQADAGLAGLAETPREFAFCLYTTQSDELLEVPDARDDARLATNPFVRGDPGVRFYAGAPLILACGTRVGSLCVLDVHVRRLSAAQRATLTQLAAVAAQALEMRRDLIDRMRAARAQAEQALAVRNAELDDLYTNAPCGYYSLDADGRLVRINDSALRWFGFTREELADRPSITDFMDADGARHFHARFPKLKRDGRVIDIEYDLVGRNGQRRHVMGSASAVRARDGSFVMTRTVVHDVTELHRAREHLRRVQQEQQAVIDNAPVGIVKVRDDTITWANKGIEKLLGWSPQELAGRCTRLLHPDEQPWSHPAGGVHRCQETLRCKDGSALVADLSIAPMSGHPGELLWMLQDIGDIRRAQEVRLRADAIEAENRQLLEAARVKGVFLANMSHELYTPLNAIIGYAHLLGTGAFPPDSPKFARFLADIGASGQQLLAHAQHALASTEAESGSISMAPQRVALRGVLEGVVDIARAAARERDVRVALAMAPEPLELVIDPMRLSQAVLHTLSNAIRFSPVGGDVTIRVVADTRECRIEVQDRGTGIAPEDMPRLFVPLHHRGEGRAREHPGARLGLALVRHLVQAQGGRIEVESAPGVGTTFVFAFPRAEGAGPG